MDPVRAICTRATYPVAGSNSQSTGAHVTGGCYRWVSISLVRQGKYGGFMTTSIYFPSPRDGLDEGSLAELAQDSRDIELHVAAPRPWVTSSYGLIDVPDDASALIDGLAAYGVTA